MSFKLGLEYSPHFLINPCMISDLPALAEFLERSVKNFTDIAVVGTSGGVDSSVVASICVKALGPKSVHLVSMPYDEIDTQSFNARSTELAERLKARHHIISIGQATKDLESSVTDSFAHGELELLTKANLRPRLRMTVLYAISGEIGLKTEKRTRVMGTGHLSEDLIGYDTKGGDALADIFILSDLLKSEVYQLANYYSVPQSIVDAEPSAGLYPGQTDAGELGYTYAVLEKATLALFKIISRGVEPKDISLEAPEFRGLEPDKVNFVIQRYQTHFHKHRAPATISCRRAEWFQ